MKGKKWPFWAGLAVSFGLLGWLILRHWERLSALGPELRYSFLALSLASAAGAHFLAGAGQKEILRLLGYRLRFLHTTGVAMVCTVANHLLTVGGASGFALRAHLLKRQGVPYGKTMTLSAVWSLCMNAVLALMVAQGFVLTLWYLDGDPLPKTGSFISVAFPMVATFVLLGVILHHEWRSRWTRKAFSSLNHIVYLVSRQEIPEHHFEDFDADLTLGLRSIWSRKGHLTGAIALICADWFFTFGTFYAALLAVGVEMPVGPLILVFAMGVLTSGVPLLPGGLGVMEGAMAGLLSQFDVDFERALLAALVFRLFYHLVPVVLSLPVYQWLRSAPQLSARLDAVPEPAK